MAAGGAPENSGVDSLDAMPTSADPSIEPVTCDSCGAPAHDTEAVHRVYVTPGVWDLTDVGRDEAREQVEVVDGVEQWCFPCRSQYPHQPRGG